MKNVFDGFFWRLDTAKEIVSLKNCLSKLPKFKCKMNKEWNGRTEYLRLWDHYKRCSMYIIDREIRRRRKKIRSRRNIWNNNIWEFSQIVDRQQVIDPGSSDNTRKINTENSTLKHILFDLQKTKDKDKLLREVVRKKEELLRDRDKNYIRLFITNYTSKIRINV